MKNLLAVLFITLVLLSGVATPAQQKTNMRPTILPLPHPVTGMNGYSFAVYPDALDLGALAIDDTSHTEDLLWSYSIPTPAHYMINGVSPLNRATDSPVNPPVNAQMNRWVDSREWNPDGQANTITIRNTYLSPLSGASSSTPTPLGIIASETQPVTFFCSDGNAFSSQTVFFYTDSQGSNRLSGHQQFTPLKGMPDKITKFWHSAEWNMLASAGHPFNLTTSTYGTTGQGICLKAGLTGYNWGALVSAYPYFNLAANQVYRIRLKMMGSQTTLGKTPFWDFILENFDDLTPGMLNMYIFSTAFYDVEGGANGLSTKGKTVTLYWAPPAISTAQWNDASTGAFVSARDKINDPRLRFRTIDADGCGNGELRYGDLCITEIEVASAPIANCLVARNLVNLTTFVESTASAKGNVSYTPLLPGMSKATFSGGTVKIEPAVSTGGWDGRQGELAELAPTTDTRYDRNPYQSYNFDEYPIPWDSGKILRMQAGLSAPTTYDENHPWDAVCFLLVSFTNEVNSESYITAAAKCGSPRTGTPQTYTAFFSTHNETKSLVAGFHRLRWALRFLNSPWVNFPTNADKLNTGSVKLHNFRVDEVVFK